MSEKIKDGGPALQHMVKVLMDYRCSRTVDDEGNPLPLVDALSPGEGGTIQLGTEEIEILAEHILADWSHPEHAWKVPDGMVLVPRDPSGEMLDAAIDACEGFEGEDEVDAVWEAMLSAREAKS